VSSPAVKPTPTPGCRIDLKVTPGAKSDEVLGWSGEVLRVKVRAPALEGRANEAVLEMLAGHLGIPRRGITLLRGDTSRQKTIAIAGLTLAEVRARLTAR
jgi:uncharacterized protein